MGLLLGVELGCLVSDVRLQLEICGLGLFLANFFGGDVRFDLGKSSVTVGV